MWRKQESSVVTLTLLVTLFFSPMATLFKSESTLAQSTKTESSSPSLKLPEEVPVGTNLRIDGSTSMAIINQALKQGFQENYPNTNIETNYRGTDAALKALENGKIDLAAIGRPLTPAEKAKGFVEAAVGREKIAMIIGPDNPFNGSITYAQFAQIFRGEITDWSEVGGERGKIRVIDRPETSDTRQAFLNYPVFQEKEFTTGSNSIQVDRDYTQEVIEKLGKNGIGYAIANQVFKKEGVRVILMDQILPDDVRYPFSQPLVYVYKETPTPDISSFLSFATAETGQRVIQNSTVFADAAVLSGLKASGDKQKIPQNNASQDVETPEANISAVVDKDRDATPETTTEKPEQKTTVTITKPQKPNSLQVNNSKTTTATIPNVGASSKQKNQSKFQTTGTSKANNPNTGGVVSEDQNLAFASPTAKDVKSATEVLESEIPVWLWWLIPLPFLAIFIGLLFRKGSNTATDTLKTAQDFPVVGDTSSEMGTVKDINSEVIPDNSPIVINDSAASTTTLPTAAENSTSTETTTATPNHSPDINLENAAVVGGLGALGLSTPSEAAPAPAIDVSQESQLSDTNVNVEETQQTDINLENAAVVGGLGALGLSVPSETAPTPTIDVSEESQINAAKFNVGQTDDGKGDLTTVDIGLAELPNGYDEKCIVLMPCDPEWAYVYWDIPNEEKEELIRQGGSQLALRLYDVTNIDLNQQTPQSVEQFECDSMARDWYLPMPMSDRDYIVEIGYITGDEKWLLLARSGAARIPPLYPSDWNDDKFIKIPWNEQLDGSKTFFQLVPPDPKQLAYNNAFLFASKHEQEQNVGLSHYPSGVGMSALAASTSTPATSSDYFWFFADMSLIVYGATQVNAQLTINGEPIKVENDGSFSIHLPFPEGVTESRMMAVAVNGWQNESLHLQFTREIPQPTEPKHWADRDALLFAPTPERSISEETVDVSNSASDADYCKSIAASHPDFFWFFADASLVIYGATQANTQVTINGDPVKLGDDGSFSVNLPFPEGVKEYQIMARAADSSKTESLHLKFTRKTLQHKKIG